MPAIRPSPRTRGSWRWAPHHGGIWGSNMFPADDPGAQTQTFAGHAVRRSPLALAVSGGTAGVCPVLGASSAVLTQALADKMNVIRGLDVAFYLGHHTAGTWGTTRATTATGATATPCRACRGSRSIR